ncbi:MAG: type III pantothenate kinase [Hydrogenoanaerobacterium sp.]
MVLAIDIGNSNIVIGGFKDSTPLFVTRISTDASRTKFEYAVVLNDLLGLYGYKKTDITGAIISSVVPPLSSVIQGAVRLVNPVRVLAVEPGIKTGLDIKIDNPGQLGADLLATAVGAFSKYPLPAVIIDLGTATKITVVDKNRCFRGGAIMPGVMIALRALSSKTAQLPQISLSDGVQNAIGTNTVDCMRAGVILGTASMIDGMLERYKKVLGNDITVIACGGLTDAIVPYCESKIIKDPYLILNGLLELYKKNTPQEI